MTKRKADQTVECEGKKYKVSDLLTPFEIRKLTACQCAEVARIMAADRAREALWNPEPYPFVHLW